ncbi:MAG: hypothetical protein ACOH2E_02485 [Candidatus Paracaedibacter sp.]
MPQANVTEGDLVKGLQGLVPDNPALTMTYLFHIKLLTPREEGAIN